MVAVGMGLMVSIKSIMNAKGRISAMSKLQDGFYWIQLKGDKPEVVEIRDNYMYRTGEESSIRFKDGKWCDWNDPIDLVVLSGPLEVPEHTI